MDPAAWSRVAAELAAARARFPHAGAVTDEALAAVLDEQLPAQREPAAALAKLRIDDLLLARWCTTGDPRAIATFEEVYRADIDVVLARFRRLATPADELRQLLRIKLFVGDPSAGRPPRIASYSGFGFLQNWLRVTALRALVDVARGEHTRTLEELIDDDALFDVGTPSPELASRYGKAELGNAIKRAFARAVAALAPRQRNFLRHAHVDELTLDEIAKLYRIHRATVARTLADARAQLIAATRRELGGLLELGDGDLDSIVRAADSRIDLSLSRVLRTPDAE
jgi:RNA polymerase sigma-70 factor (ECF subfamily)